MPEVYALAFGAHPDDVELSCGATLLKLQKEGHKVAVCDLTEGELGTRGTPAERRREAKAAAEAMGYTDRINLNLGDGNIEQNRDNLLAIVCIIRHFRPTLVLASPPEERHPDHEHASRLVKEAVFYAGLQNIKTTYKGRTQTSHRPKHLIYYIQSLHTEPSFVVDVSETFEAARQGILAFKSQFYRPESKEPETHISRADFLTGIEARARYFGEQIGVKYGEGFIYPRILGVSNLSGLLT
ncbi:MAG: bacillithiol biosynthesis deacetylase BshB1 [Chlorobiales bacterium]|jgi:N-acetylglucosamine malate deacetylase 1|nr:bacillithiol biosynthesis deacetylase BshB1 [Chlorobiales bacterium]